MGQNEESSARRLLIGLLAATAFAGLTFSLTAWAEAAEKLRVVAFAASSNAALWIAQEKGYFQEEGLEVEFMIIDSGPASATAVASGDADIGITGPSAAFYNLASQGVLKMIGGSSRDYPGYPLLGLVVSNQAYDRGLKAIGDLRTFGPIRVGITARGSIVDYQINAIWRKLGIDGQFDLVQLGSMGNAVSAIAGGSVDISSVPTVEALKLDRLGQGKLIGWTGDTNSTQSGVVFVNPDLLTSRSEAVRKFLSSMRKASRLYGDVLLNKTASTELEREEELLGMIAKYTHQEIDSLRSALSYVDPEVKLDLDAVDDQISWFKAQGVLDQKADLSLVVDHDFVPEVSQRPR